MASPTPDWDNVWGQITKIVDLYDTEHTNALTWATKQDTYEQDIEGQHAAGSRSVIAGHRATKSGILSGIRAALDPCIRELGRVISSNKTSTSDIWADVVRYMIDNNKDVNGRNATQNSFSAVGGNTGDGAPLRLTLDQDNMPIEGGFGGAFGSFFATTLRLRCIADQNTGAQENNAQFELMTEGTVPTDGLFPVTSLPFRLPVLAKSGDDSVSGFNNPHFSQYNSGAGVSKFTGWTLSTAGNATQDTSNVYRADRNGTSSAMKITATVTCQQTIDQRISIDPGTPYCLHVPWNIQVGTGIGTILVRMGATSTSVVTSGETGWQILSISAVQGCWPRSFTEDDMDISIEWTHTGGYLLVDDVYFGPMTGPYGGFGYLHVPNGATEFLLEDEFTNAITEAGAKIQEWLDRAGFGYAPSVNDASETISDP